MATIVLGAQWGDEGKGKIVDVIAGGGIQLCCRAQGGHNAGHTIVKNGHTFDVHILRKFTAVEIPAPAHCFRVAPNAQYSRIFTRISH